MITDFLNNNKQLFNHKKTKKHQSRTTVLDKTQEEMWEPLRNRIIHNNHFTLIIQFLFLSEAKTDNYD